MKKICLFLACGAVFPQVVTAADHTVRGLIAEAKTFSGGLALVSGSPVSAEVFGDITDVDGDVFCVAKGLPNTSAKVEYCFPYSSVVAVVKPGTEPDTKYTTIWVTGRK